MKRQKTPDFRVYHGEDCAFYCEVKEVARDDWMHGARPDPIYNRLTDDIHIAFKQFRSVNSNHCDPNVLAIVNNDEKCGFLDFLAVTTGCFYADDGSAVPIYQQFSEGRIREEKWEIDLCLWFNPFESDQPLLHFINEMHLERLRGYFKIDSLKNIGDTL